MNNENFEQFRSAENVKGGPLTKKSKKSLTKPKNGGERLIVPKNRKGEMIFRCFGCVQNQVLCTFDKSAQCTKSCTYNEACGLKKKRKLATVIVGHFLSKAPPKNGMNERGDPLHQLRCVSAGRSGSLVVSVKSVHYSYIVI